MGCCLTTVNGGRNSQIGSESSKIDKSTPSENRAPPSIEEETVKEVLSETPKLIKLEFQYHNEEEEDDKQKQKKDFHIDPAPFSDDEINKKEMNFREEDLVSEKENSEVCSLSIGGETVSTTTVDYGCNDDEREVKQRVKRSPAKLPAKNRSISGDFGCRIERMTGKSPNRRTDQSPDKRNNAGGGARGGCGSVKPGQIRESSVGGRRVLRPDPYRRDSGEGSRRRSRSPAINRSATIGRSPSARRTNGSPGRVRTDLPDKMASNSSMGTNTAPPPNESLENPLVSLECFIFL